MEITRQFFASVDNAEDSFQMLYKFCWQVFTKRDKNWIQVSCFYLQFDCYAPTFIRG